MNIPVRIIPDVKYIDMYRLQWEDGVLSEDFYNETRANDILRNYEEYVRGMEMRGNSRARPQKNSLTLVQKQGLDALKPLEGTHVA